MNAMEQHLINQRAELEKCIAHYDSLPPSDYATKEARNARAEVRRINEELAAAYSREEL